MADLQEIAHRLRHGARHPPRTLVLNHNLREHGTYFRAWNVALQLQRLGSEVTFVTTGEGYYRPRVGTRQGINWCESPNWSPFHDPDEGWSPLGVLWRAGLSISRGWDLVYSFSHRPSDQIPARLARGLRGAAWVCDWCDLYGGEGILAMRREARGTANGLRGRLRDSCDRLDERLEIAAARGCEFLTVISRLLEGRAMAEGRSARRIHRMLSGADTRRIRPLPARSCRERLGLPTDRLLAGYVANYHPDERLLLEAFSHAASVRGDLDLAVAGPPFYGGTQTVRTHGLQGRIHHVGRLPFSRIPLFLGAADFLLVPITDSAFNQSRWPNKIGDHLAAGRAQVVCRVGEAGEFFSRHRAAVVTEPDSKSFSAGILQLAEDGELRRELSRAARRVAEQELSWEGLVDDLLSAMETA